ncbi:MAG TPA: citrate/2-methylcitrate synthase [Tepidiformaceae bacterium]|nr:citrate synthase [Thermoflexaceae bacterium]HMS58278.1 citrate/2-methylcitrate synthase [Tepidiformaceae bacterium]
MTEIARGLEGINVTATKLCRIDGQKGELIYSGYNIYDLADKSSFEEVAFLLWNQRLPNKQELSDLKTLLNKERPLDNIVERLIRELWPHVRPMRTLEIAVEVIGAIDPDSSDLTQPTLRTTAARLTAKMATVIAAYDRLRNGKEPVAPRDDLGHAANFLYMLTGEEPTELAKRVMDVAFILHAEHEMNASTFSAMVTGSTLSDMYSAIASAIGTLKGPLHGGANEAVFKTVDAIKEEKNIAPHVEALLGRGERVMGIGHRIYKTTDPRAVILERLGHQVAETSPDRWYFDLSLKLRDYLARKLEGRPLYPNVDFFSASVYRMLGIPSDLYTPIFALARITGWTAHLLEQYADNRLVRPNALYEGAANREYIPVESR